MQNKELIEKWLSGHLSKEEAEAFRQSADYRSLVKLDEALLDYKAPNFDMEAALEAITEHRKPAGRVVQFRSFDILLRVAAVVSIVIIGYLLIFQNKLTTYSTGAGEKDLVSLPDNSSVRLNAFSSLSFNEDEWSQSRETSLTGEAYFIVAKGSRFDVHTESGVISVLGTQFNVKSRPGFFEVDCYEGHVAVVVRQDTVELLAGDGLRILANGAKKLKVDGLKPSWTNNESSFDTVPFAEVIAEFERQFAVRIETKNVDLNKFYSGSFTHTDFDIALKSIATPLNLTIEKTTNQHIVLSAVEE